MKKVAISQSNYLPWKGYFDQIQLVDEFVLYDDVQFTRRDWRNRNRIKTHQGLKWLTVPVKVKGRYFQSIRETEISEPDWAVKHWRLIRENYAHAEGLDECMHEFQAAFERCGEYKFLSEVNRDLLQTVANRLGITTPLRCSSEFKLIGDRSERLLNLCQQLNADVYLSGPAAKSYLDVELFAEAGVRVEWMTYAGYPEYPQLHGGPFEHSVSIIDLVLNTGSDAARFIRRSPDNT